MKIMISRNDRRMRSIRSLPQGQFVKFLEMFNSSRHHSDDNNSTSNKYASESMTKIKNEATTGSLSWSSSPISSDFKSNLIYEEINNLNTSADQTNDDDENDNDDKEVEYILGRGELTNNSTKSSEIIYSNESSNSSHDFSFKNLSNNKNSSFTNNITNPMFHGVSEDTKTLLKSICSSNEEIATFLGEKNKPTNDKKENVNVTNYSNEYSWYQAVPVTIYQNEEYNNIKDLVNFDKNLENISYIESNSDSLDEYLDSKNVNNNNINDINLNDVEFSDDSYDETDEYSNHGYEIKLNVLRLQDKEEEFLKIIDEFDNNTAPPKPMRTFEHDIYVENKNLLNLKNKSFLNINNKKRHSLTNNAERQIIKLIESHNTNSNNEHIYETLPSIKLKDSQSQFDVILRKNLQIYDEPPEDQSDENNLSSQSSKFTLSEPNLSIIGKSEINKNSKNNTIKPFGKFLNQIRKTISRKSVNSDEETNQLSKQERWKQFADLKYEFTTNAARVKSHIYADANELIIEKRSLFDYVIIVGLRERNKSHSSDDLNSDFFTNKLNPVILWKFPENPKNFNNSIEHFCFPDASCHSELKKSNNEIFQFTLTNYDGTRSYGYCIRLFNKKNPIVFCIISQADALEMYQTLLIETAKLYAVSLDDAKLFLSALYAKLLPKRGESINVTFGLNDKKEIVLNRSYDRRLEHINLHVILNYSIDVIVKIFTSMLAEKKIIFLSSKLSLLSNTIQAFETLLYPFNWPHTFIPVLPSYLVEMCEAPTPYLIGLMRTNLKLISKYKDDNDTLIVDLDKNKILNEDTNESEMFKMPKKALNQLKSDLANLIRISKSRKESQKNIELCWIFLRFFIELIGHYKEYIIPLERNLLGERELIFMTKEFINESSEQEVVHFLDWFIHTQLFDVFITKKLNPNLKFGLMFDNAIIKTKFGFKPKETSPKMKKIKQISRILSNVYKF